MRVELTPEAAAFAARELARRPELNHTLTVEAFLVSGCCSPNLPPEVHLGLPPQGDFQAVTVPLAAAGGAGRAGGDGGGRPDGADGGSGPGAASPAALEEGATVPAVEVYVDPLVADFVRDWYGEEDRDRAEQAVLRIDLVRYPGREELTVRPWPPEPAAATGDGRP